MRFTRHATQRMEQMGLDEARVLDVLTNPELVMPNDPHHPPGRKYMAMGIVVAVSLDESIMTVLWHGAEGRRDDGGPDFEITLAS